MNPDTTTEDTTNEAPGTPDEVQEETVQEPLPNEIITMRVTLSNTRANLELLATEMKYPETVRDPNATENTPIEQCLIPNTEDKITFLRREIQDFLAKVVAEKFKQIAARQVEDQKKQLDQMIVASEQTAYESAKNSIVVD